jgi:hypothetical protein
MKHTVVRYKARPESADENQRLIEQVFRELHVSLPDGVRYLVLRLEDDTFLHFVGTDRADGKSLLPELDAFRSFQSGIKERCVEPPRPSPATIVGSYRMLETS